MSTFTDKMRGTLELILEKVVKNRSHAIPNAMNLNGEWHIFRARLWSGGP